jgi:type II secretory pathway pseudopilin PulG
MKHTGRCDGSPNRDAFSLVEVVLALGVVAFAIVAILGVLPTGLQTSRGSQDETRAAQIAQAIFASLASQNLQRDVNGQVELDVNGHLQLNSAAKLPLPNNQTFLVDLKASATPTTPDLYADNDGNFTQTVADGTYAITFRKNTSPAGFDPPAGSEVFANEVCVTVGWPGSAVPANQTKRDFVRVISKY